MRHAIFLACIIVAQMAFMPVPGTQQPPHPPSPPPGSSASQPPPPPTAPPGALGAPPSSIAIADPDRWWKNQLVARQLQLTELQMERLEKIDADNKPSLARLRADVSKLSLALRVMLADEVIEDKKISQQADLLIAARAELERIDASRTLALRQILSASQWKTLHAILPPTGG